MALIDRIREEQKRFRDEQNVQRNPKQIKVTPYRPSLVERVQRGAQRVTDYAGATTLAKSLGAAIGTRPQSDMASMRDNLKSAANTALTIGTLGLPAAKIPRAVQSARPLLRLAGSSAIRGAEGAGLSLARDLINTGDVNQSLRNVPKNFGLGAASNAILSPRLSLRAAGDAAQLTGQAARAATYDPAGNLRTFSGSVKLPVPTPKQPQKPALRTKPAQATPPSPRKERGFITSVKEGKNTPPNVAQRVSGTYKQRNTNADLNTARKQVAAKWNDAFNEALTTTQSDRATNARSLAVIERLFAEGDEVNAIEAINKLAPRATEAGQAAQIFAAYDKLTPVGATRYAAKELARLGRRLSPEDARMIADKAKAFKAFPEGSKERLRGIQDLIDTLSEVAPSSAAAQTAQVWKAGLLTGLKTTGGNVVSNVAHNVLEVGKDVNAAFFDVLQAPFTGQRGVTFTLGGRGQGLKEGVGKGVEYFKTGVDTRRNPAARLNEGAQVAFSKNLLGRAAKKYVNTVFRSLGAQDQPFWYSAFRGSLYNQAKVIGMNQKLSPEQVRKLAASPKPEMLRIAKQEADMATFQNQTALGNAGLGLKRALGPVGEVLAPFTQTPAAIANQVVNYSPVGAVKAILNKNNLTQREFSQALGRAATGIELLGIGAWLYRSGRLTLASPSSEQERAQWELEGKKPNSVLIGGKWRSLNYLAPFGNVLLVGGHYAQGGPGQAIAGGARSLTDQTFLQGISGALDAINDPSGSRIQGFNQRLAGSVIPTLVSDVAQATDPLQRETKNAGVAAGIQARVPGLRQGLVPKRDVLGREIERNNGFLGTLLDPLRSSPAKSDPIVDELRRLSNAGYGTTPTFLDRNQTIAGTKVSLNPAQLDRLEQFVGDETRTKWESIMARPGYQTLDDEQKSSLLAKVRDDVRAVGRVRLGVEEGLISSADASRAVMKLTKEQRNLLLNPGQYRVSVPKPTKDKSLGPQTTTRVIDRILATSPDYDTYGLIPRASAAGGSLDTQGTAVPQGNVSVNNVAQIERVMATVAPKRKGRVRLSKGMKTIKGSSSKMPKLKLPKLPKGTTKLPKAPTASGARLSAVNLPEAKVTNVTRPRFSSATAQRVANTAAPRKVRIRAARKSK